METISGCVRAEMYFRQRRCRISDAESRCGGTWNIFPDTYSIRFGTVAIGRINDYTSGNRNVTMFFSTMVSLLISMYVCMYIPCSFGFNMKIKFVSAVVCVCVCVLAIIMMVITKHIGINC